MHTLDAAWMVDVASGAAPKAVRILAACQAELNADAYALLTQAERVMGSFLEDEQPVLLRNGSFQALLDQLDAGPQRLEHDSSHSVDEMPASLPQTLKHVLSHQPNPVWIPKLGGVQEMALDTLEEDGVHVRLLSLPPGRGVSEHAHQAEELTLVLQGGFNDGHADYRAGDVCHADSTLTHNPRAHPDGPCICLSVEMGRLYFTHPLMSLASRILGWNRF